MSYTVIFTPEAQQQILELYRYIATASSPEIAEIIPVQSSLIAKACKPSLNVEYRALIFVPTYALPIIKNGQLLLFMYQMRLLP